jgi:hypothetical protein
MSLKQGPSSRSLQWLLGAAVLATASVAGASSAVPPIPEPTGLALFAVGAAAVVVAIRTGRGR